jgi:uncharacterized phage protein (TIGR01671 family)
MREIKFRAWIKNGFDKDIKPFMTYEIERIHFNIGEAGIDAEDCEWDMDNVELMQYTGLKDKNGKEIYEGDICKNGDWENDAHSYNYRKEVVEYIESEGCFKGWNYNVDGMTCEIIGNIYENPKLLRKD